MNSQTAEVKSNHSRITALDKLWQTSTILRMSAAKVNNKMQPSHLLGNLTTELVQIGSGVGNLLSSTNHIHRALQRTTPSEQHTIILMLIFIN